MRDISYQLYSSREFPPLSDTLKMLAGIGYTQVEGFGGVYDDPAQLADLLKQNNLTMPTGHFSLDDLENQTQKVFDIVNAVGMKTVFCPFLLPDDRPDDAAGWRAFGARLQKAGTVYRDAGLGFGWHNHDFEFKQADGTIPMEEIFAGGPDLSWEADIAWIIRGGGDPFDWIKRHGDRIIAVHVKDIAPQGECQDEDGWADVGHGTVDWNQLIPALLKTGAQYYIMEHDKPNDDRRFAARSFETLNALLGAGS